MPSSGRTTSAARCHRFASTNFFCAYCFCPPSLNACASARCAEKQSPAKPLTSAPRSAEPSPIVASSPFASAAMRSAAPSGNSHGERRCSCVHTGTAPTLGMSRVGTMGFDALDDELEVEGEADVDAEPDVDA